MPAKPGGDRQQLVCTTNTRFASGTASNHFTIISRSIPLISHDEPPGAFSVCWAVLAVTSANTKATSYCSGVQVTTPPEPRSASHIVYEYEYQEGGNKLAFSVGLGALLDQVH